MLPISLFKVCGHKQSDCIYDDFHYMLKRVFLFVVWCMNSHNKMIQPGKKRIYEIAFLCPFI